MAAASYWMYELSARKVRPPALARIDGDPDLYAALRTQRPEITLQCCTKQKLRNQLAKVPARLREELSEDYRRMVHAETREAVAQARRLCAQMAGCTVRQSLVRLKRPAMNCSPSCSSLQSQGKALRTTNAL
jgi:transposase-like protein